jgi:putative polyhydroxyalkanoate system protein
MVAGKGGVMSHIQIRRQHALAPQDARKLAEDVALRLQRRYELTYRWDGDALHFEREGVDGTLHLEPGLILIQARLGFLLSLASDQIEQEIAMQLDHVLRQAGPGSDTGQPEGARGA